MFKTSHLEALSAVCESGSFEIAASMLGITQSALSQRIGALEREAGLVLVERSRPVEPTRPGRTVLGLARQVMLLSSDAERLLAADSSLPDASGMTRVSLAINADSISTWFQPVIAQVAAERSLLLDLHVEDQDHTAALLREGRVMAAVTTSGAPAPGCTVERLGTMVYWPACAPSLIKGLKEEEVDLGRLPMLRFDAKDDLQHSYLRQTAVENQPPRPLHPVEPRVPYGRPTRTRLGRAPRGPDHQRPRDRQAGQAAPGSQRAGGTVLAAVEAGLPHPRLADEDRATRGGT